jgi:two-component system sensor histidine kinase/response regulator
VAAGLRHANGNSDLYIRLLRNFAVDFDGFAANVETMLESGDWLAASGRAHTLKGLAATLGAWEVRALTTGLEQAIRGRDLVFARQHLAQTGSSLDSVLSAVRIVFNDAEFALADHSPEDERYGPTWQPDGESAPIASWLPHLRALLEQGDAEALTYWRTRKLEIGKQMPEELIERMTAKIDGFDFDAALSLLALAQDP